MPYESPASILFNSNGIELAVTGGFAVPVSTSALLAAGMTTAGTASYLKTTDDGTLFITGSFTTAGVQQVTGTVAIQGITNVSGAFPVFISASNLLTVTGSITVGNQPTVNQGNAGTIGQSWFTRITDGTQVVGTGSSAPLFTQEAINTGSFVTFFSPSTTVTALIPSASQVRKGVTIYNDTNRVTSILYGSGTVNTTNNFSIKVSIGGYVEVPSQFSGPVYAVWANDTGSGLVLVTEFFN